VTRRPTSIILSVVFGLLALAASGQVFMSLRSSDEPPTLTVLHFGSGLAAAATAWGSWCRAGWASGAVIAYGAITASLLTALPSLLRLPADARLGIWTGGAAVMLFALLCSAYFRFDARRHNGRISTEQANKR
jgi:hypothetical protein